jgi:hypothetical protein
MRTPTPEEEIKVQSWGLCCFLVALPTTLSRVKTEIQSNLRTILAFVFFKVPMTLDLIGPVQDTKIPRFKHPLAPIMMPFRHRSHMFSSVRTLPSKLRTCLRFAPAGVCLKATQGGPRLPTRITVLYSTALYVPPNTRHQICDRREFSRQFVTPVDSDNRITIV